MKSSDTASQEWKGEKEEGEAGGSRSRQGKLNSGDPVSGNFVAAVTGALEDTCLCGNQEVCLFTVRTLETWGRHVNPIEGRQPRARSESKTGTILSELHGLGTTRLADSRSEYCKSKCINRFGPPRM
jgi:hypothetical protein